MQSSGVPFAESRILQAIGKYEDEILEAIGNYLNRCVANGFDGDNAVCGLWLASGLIDSSDLAPRFYVGVGEDEDDQFNGPACLSQNALNKAKATAQAGMDTLDIVNNPVHWLAVEGRYYPWGGAIIRRIGRTEFVVSTSGFKQEEDHRVSEGVWGIIITFIVKDIADDLRRADLDEDDPEYRKYPIGQLSNDDALHITGWDVQQLFPTLGPKYYGD